MSELFQTDLSLIQWFIFAFAGLLTGVINTLAGSGSLITLPIFIFICGLPADVANGTNRIGALFQSATGVRAFHKQGELHLKGIVWIAVPIVLGAALGARIAVSLDEQMMNYSIGGLMVFMLIVLLINPKRWIRETTADIQKHKRPLNLLAFFLIGVYGGFIQAGVGIFLLAGLVLLSGYSLKASNGIKLVVVFLFNIPAIYIFLSMNQIHFGYGIAMALFQSIGAYLGVKWISQIPNANVWIHRLLILIVIASAFKFLGVYSWIYNQFIL